MIFFNLNILEFLHALPNAVSRADEKSARPVVLQNKGDHLKPEETSTDSADDQSSDFETAVVTKSKTDVPKDSSDDEKADDFAFPQNYGFPGQYGETYGLDRPNDRRHNNQHMSPYKRRPNHPPPGYKPGHVHSYGENRIYQPQPKRYDHKPERRTYTGHNHGYGARERVRPKVKTYTYPVWHKNEEQRVPVYGSPRKHLKHEIYEERHNNYGKQLDSHNPYPHRMDGYVNAFDGYARQARAKYDPNKNGTVMITRLFESHLAK